MKYTATFFLVLAWLAAATQDTTRLVLMFSGDIMQHDSQLQAAYNVHSGTYAYDTCFYFMRRYFAMADLAIANLELTLGGKPYRGYPQFSAPDELAAALKRAGIDVLLTANNHSLDRRRKGLERTIRVLDSLHLYHTGTFRDTVERLNDYPLFLEKNGITLALLNYTYGTNGIPITAPNVVNLIDTAIIARDLQRAKQLQPDVIVVFMHWGNEYQHQPASDQQRLAEFCFQRGANIVVGAHPHVLQPMYWYRQKNSVLAYSLGNFISGQRDHPRDGAASLFIEISKVYSADTCYALITDARYLLHWVYRTPLPQRKFVVLPVTDFETNTHYIADEASLTAFHKFITHARALLAVRNNRIPEINVPLPDSIVRYKVVWRVPAFRADTMRLTQADKVFGLYRHPEPDNQVRFETGTFKTYTAALHYWQRIRRRYPEGVIQKQVLK